METRFYLTVFNTNTVMFLLTGSEEKVKTGRLATVQRCSHSDIYYPQIGPS